MSLSIDTDTRVHRLEIDLAALKEQVKFFNIIYTKLDETLSKIQEMNEHRRTQANDDIKDVYNKLEDTESKIMDEIHKLRIEMKEQHQREQRKLADLDKWRWMVVGAALAAGYVISRFTYNLH